MEAVETVLRAPGDLEDVVGLAGLPVGGRDTDPRLAQVVPGGLDKDAAREAGVPVLVIEPRVSLSPD